MKKIFIITATLIVALAAFTACSGTPKASGADGLDMAIREASDYLNDNISQGSKIVILNVQSDSTALSEYIIDELIANAVNDKLFEVVDRAQLDLIRTEQNFQLSGEVDDKYALEIGKFFGAQIIVSGRVSQIGSRYRFTIRALEVQTARVVGQDNINIAAGETITTLMKSGQATATASGQSSGGQRTQTASSGQTAQTTSGSGTAQTTPAQPTTPTAQPTAIPNGTYTFWPRPQAKEAGIDQDCYLDKIVVRSGYFIVYLARVGNGGMASWGNNWNSNWPDRTKIQDLDRPSRTYSAVQGGQEDRLRLFSFQNVNVRRFSLYNDYNNPPTIFDEINLADAEYEP